MQKFKIAEIISNTMVESLNVVFSKVNFSIFRTTQDATGLVSIYPVLDDRLAVSHYLTTKPSQAFCGHSGISVLGVVCSLYAIILYEYYYQVKYIIRCACPIHGEAYCCGTERMIGAGYTTRHKKHNTKSHNRRQSTILARSKSSPTSIYALTTEQATIATITTRLHCCESIHFDNQHHDGCCSRKTFAAPHEQKAQP